VAKKKTLSLGGKAYQYVARASAFRMLLKYYEWQLNFKG